MSDRKDSRSPARQRLVVPAVAIAATAVVAAVGVLVPQVGPAETGATVPIEPRTSTICAVHAEDDRSLDLVGGAVADGSGKLSLGDLERQRSVGDPLTESGVVAVGAGARPYTVTATGAMTATAAGALVGRAGDGTNRGLAAQACSPPGTDHWFVGLGAGKSQFSTVLVTNPDAQAAEVELRVHGPRGPVTAPGSSGIPIPPHSTRAIPLEGMVSGDGPLAVQLRATAGRVSAVTLDRHRSATSPAGTDWVAPAGDPGTDLVVPGVPGGAGARDLVLVNPGERTSTVRVDALTASGPFTLDGADAIDVPPASTVRVPLADALDSDEAGLRITAEQPVGAALVATSSRSGFAADTATAVPSGPVRSPVVLPVVGASGVAGRVVLTNPATDSTTATVVVRDRSGAEVKREEVELEAGATVGVDAGASGAWAEVGAADGARLHVAVVLTSDRDRTAGLAWLPGISPRVGGELPSVDHDPDVAR